MKFLLVLLLLVVAAGFFAINLSLGVFGDLFSRNAGQEISGESLREQVAADLLLEELIEFEDSSESERPEKEISAPPPLRIFHAVPSAFLSNEGVFEWTNVHRQATGLPELQRSSLLDEIAQKKVDDMFALQYFAHISPLGIGVSDLAETAGYEFIAIGENLALGNYATDQALVQAWMESPGHRENILGARYREIGIAVQKGLYEGNSTWLAVQTFALPLAACDFPNEKLKEEIELGKIQIKELAAIVERMRDELETEGSKRNPSYNKKAEEYNALVDRYNKLLAQVQANIAQYNSQVQAFNQCAQS